MDKKKLFKFATLQDPKSLEILKPFAVGDDLYSFIYFENGIIYDQSTAILRICKKLGGIWFLAYSFIIVPSFIRDSIYQLIAKNRYKWFGKKENCRIPEPEIQERFL